MKRNIFIGVAWPYVNGNLHIGHLAGYLLPFDICARFHRAIGNNVLVASGSDCFGTPITIEADKRGVTPKEIVEEYHEKDVDLFKNVLGLTYDIYTKTDHPNHKQVTQDIFISFLENDLIIIKTSEQYYSPSQKRFLPDRYVIGECGYCGFKGSRSDQCDNCGKLLSQEDLKNPKSNLNDEVVELKETEHYYVDWTKLQPKLEEFVKDNGPQWRNWIYKETLGWFKEGLQPRAITRDIDWGVEIPVDRIPKDKLIDNVKNKRFYVWFDAVIGYLSASILWSKEGNGNWKDFWFDEDSKHYYFMGKDNLVFHTLFWPGQLMVYDENLHLPDIEAINQFLNFEGKQFSKSRGHVIDTREIIEKYGNDRVRFYLTLTMPETRDTIFSWDDFKEKVNGILVANLGNFIHRSLSIGKDSNISLISKLEISSDVSSAIEKAFKDAKLYLDNCEFRNYLDVVLSLSSFGNKYFDTNEVWVQKKNDSEAFQNSLANLYFIILSLGYLISPMLPEASENLFKQLDVDSGKLWPEDIGDIKTLLLYIDTTVKPTPLFEKIEEIGLD